jgi:integrase
MPVASTTRRRTRRKAGRSSILRDEQGRWQGFVSMGRRPDGRRDRRHVRGRTRAQVVVKVRELERQRDAGLPLASGRVPAVGEWVTFWLDHIAVRRLRPRTWEGYWSRARAWIIPCLGECRLDRLSPVRVEGFYSLMVEHGLAPSSVLLAHHVLSGALQAAVRRGLAVVNVCRLVDKPRRTVDEVEPLSVAEVRRVLEVAEDRRNGVRWTLALSLGLRQGEALGLLWRHVDLEAGTLRVAWQLQQLRWRHGCHDPSRCGLDHRPMARASQCPKRHGGGYHLLPPKSAKSRRTIILPEPLVAELAEHRRRQLAERLALGERWRGWDAGELVVARPYGRPVPPHQDHLEWKQLLAAAGVRDVGVHVARHTAATLLLRQGVPVRVVMDILGHTQLSQTVATYQHTPPELAVDAAERIARALWAQAA